MNDNSYEIRFGSIVLCVAIAIFAALGIRYPDYIDIHNGIVIILCAGNIIWQAAKISK